MIDFDRSFTMADIPGLIEGAHTGTGLGFEFLRHIQRTRVLIHLLDGLAEDPISDFAQINSELALFDPDLAKKPQIVAVNKMDLPDVKDHWDSLKRKLKKKGISPTAISAVTGYNVKPLLFQAFDLLRTTPLSPKEMVMPVYQPQTDPREFEIQRLPDGWRISGAIAIGAGGRHAVAPVRPTP